jgi:hypothetical protein
VQFLCLSVIRLLFHHLCVYLNAGRALNDKERCESVRQIVSRKVCSFQSLEKDLLMNAVSTNFVVTLRALEASTTQTIHFKRFEIVKVLSSSKTI